jgi:hypothetical protein
MGCIRVDKITEYLCDPLQRCLKVRHGAQPGGGARRPVAANARQPSPAAVPAAAAAEAPPGAPPQDDDPYVRKTAAVCVTKLFDINAELVEDRGFLDMLRVRLPLRRLLRAPGAGCHARAGAARAALWLLLQVASQPCIGAAAAAAVQPNPRPPFS